MPGRKYQEGDYRFGFNGKENDSEWGSQIIQDYGFRIYNPSIGKFLSVDPLTKNYPWYTPYQFAGNTPIWAIDIDGLEEAFATDYYDENRASYVRHYTLNPNANDNDIGKIQFKYSDGSSSPVLNAGKEDLRRISDLHEQSSETVRSGLPELETIGIILRLSGSTEAEKPKIVLPKEPEPVVIESEPIPEPVKTITTKKTKAKKPSPIITLPKPTPDPVLGNQNFKFKGNSNGLTFESEITAGLQIYSIAMTLETYPNLSLTIKANVGLSGGGSKTAKDYSLGTPLSTPLHDVLSGNSLPNKTQADLMKARGEVIKKMLTDWGISGDRIKVQNGEIRDGAENRSVDLIYSQ